MRQRPTVGLLTVASSAEEVITMMWGYYSGMGWWMVLSSIIWLALIGVAVWALVRWVSHHTRTPSGEPLTAPNNTWEPFGLPGGLRGHNDTVSRHTVVEHLSALQRLLRAPG